MNDNLSDLLNNLSKNINSSDGNNINPDMLKQLLDSFNSSNGSNDSNKNDNNSNPDIDLDTILKMKTIMEKMNSSKSNSSSNLLLALKPFLRQSRQSKVDQYVQLLKLAPLLEMFKNDNNSKKQKRNQLVDNTVVDNGNSVTIEEE